MPQNLPDLPNEALECLNDGGVVLVCGLPGHGKTTLSWPLAERTGARLVSVDVVRGARFIPSDECYEMARQEIDRFLSSGRPVVIDACALSARFRRLLVGGIHREVVCLWFQPNARVTEERRPAIELEPLLEALEPPRILEGFEAIVELSAA